MGTTFLAAIFAALLNLSSPAPQADTIHTYIIDGVKTESVDFSSLLGKKIVFYMSKPEKSDSGTIIIRHTVRTDQYKPGNSYENNMVTVYTSGEDVITSYYYVNGKEVSQEEFRKIKTSSIKSISVKTGEAAKKITGKEHTGVIEVILKEGTEIEQGTAAKTVSSETVDDKIIVKYGTK